MAVSTEQAKNAGLNQQFSMTNITNFVSVKLTGDNYLSWKHQMSTILKTMGLSNHVSSSTPSPLQTEARYENWCKTDSYVSTCINATLNPSIAHLAVGTTTASNLWKVLEDSYLQQAFAKKFQLKSQFQTLKQGTLSVNAYCDSVKRNSDSLRSIGENILEPDLVLQTLQGLNSVFNTFVLNIENSDQIPSFAQLRSRLLVYEQRLSNQGEASVPISAMNSVVSTPPHFSSESKSNTHGLVCQICHKPGHDASWCFYRYAAIEGRGGGRNGGGRNWKSSGRYFSRGGSVDRNWRGYVGLNNRGGGRNQSVHIAQPQAMFHGGAARFDGGFNGCVERNPNSVWSRSGDGSNIQTKLNLGYQIDSGATAHMTPNPNLVQGAQAYSGSTRVVVGNDLDRDSAPPHFA